MVSYTGNQFTACLDSMPKHTAFIEIVCVKTCYPVFFKQARHPYPGRDGTSGTTVEEGALKEHLCR